MKKLFILMQGISGSGKTTLANQMETESLLCKVLSRDKIRKEVFGLAHNAAPIPSVEAQVTIEFNRQLREACESDRYEVIVLDNTFLKVQYIKSAVDEIRQYTAPTESEIVIFKVVTPFCDCQVRRSDFPVEVLERQMKDFKSLPEPEALCAMFDLKEIITYYTEVGVGERWVKGVGYTYKF